MVDGEFDPEGREVVMAGKWVKMGAHIENYALFCSRNEVSVAEVLRVPSGEWLYWPEMDADGVEEWGIAPTLQQAVLRAEMYAGATPVVDYPSGAPS